MRFLTQLTKGILLLAVMAAAAIWMGGSSQQAAAAANLCDPVPAPGALAGANVGPFTEINTTGVKASAVCVNFTLTGGTLNSAVLIDNPAGCTHPPEVLVAGVSTVWLDWGDACVAPGDNVKFNFKSAYGAAVDSVNWTTKRAWTYIVYADGDNNLQAPILADIDEMETVGSGPNLNIVVQWDNGPAAYGAAPAPFRAWVKTHPAAGIGSTQRPIGSAATPADPLVAEPNMGDPVTLSRFLTWAKTNFPADNYALDIEDHGDSWKGIAFDETSANDGLSMDELTTGLLAAPSDLRLISFDSCMMAQLEVARQVWAYADVMVASEDCIPGAGYPYNTMLAALKANPAWTAEDLGKDMVDKYATYWQGLGNQDYTLSAFRLNAELLNLVSDVSNLGDGLRLGIENYHNHLDPIDNVQLGIKAARSATHEPTLGCGREAAGCLNHDDIPDLMDLTLKLDAEPRIDALYKPGTAGIRWRWNNMICLRERHGSNQGAGDTNACNDGGANGLTIYFPKAESGSNPPTFNLSFDSGSDTNTLYAPNPIWDAGDGLPAPPNHPLPAQAGFTFPATTQWDEFLYRYYRPVADAGGPVTGVVGGPPVILDGTGSSDADGIVAKYLWDLDLGVNSDVTDTDRDGPDTAFDDQNNAIDTAPKVNFVCQAPGVFFVRLVVRDDHETIHPPQAGPPPPSGPPLFQGHFNADDEFTTVTCNAPPAAVGGTIELLTNRGTHGSNVSWHEMAIGSTVLVAISSWYVLRRRRA